MPEPAPLISLIVPCFNDVAHLGDLMESLVRLDCDRPWELIVKDNASTRTEGRPARATLASGQRSDKT